MNDTPRTIEVRHGEDNEDIGKELAHAHKLLCRLRHAGAMRNDLVAIRNADLAILGEFIAMVRGVRTPNDFEPDARIINLDYEPACGYLGSLTILSGGLLDYKNARVIRDVRLGMWPVRQEAGSFIFGNMKFVVVRPSGFCVEGNLFGPSHFVGLPNDHEHLNLAMAAWFSKDGRIDIPFDGPPFGKEWGNDSIFFLGSVWWDSQSKKYFAPALTSNKKEQIKLEVKRIPDGEWPNNCYVALLVPR